MFLRSIRVKVTIWYIVIMAITLLLFSVLLYHNFSSSLYEDLDDLLQSKAEGISSSIDTYWEAERLDRLQHGIKESAEIKSSNIDFLKIAQRWVSEKSNDPKLTGIIVQIFDIKGANILSSKTVRGLTVLPEDIFDTVVEGEGTFDTVKVPIPGEKQAMYRAFTTPVIRDSKAAYIIQVASPLKDIQQSLYNLRMILFLLLPLTVFLTGILGVFIANLALNPVGNIIKTIRQITMENLKLRIKTPGTKDEIQRLAETFNDMLERLEISFSSQRQFMQDVSHELKTPLTILKGELEVTLKKIRSATEYESVLQSSLEEINRISKIVDSLLILARFDSKEMPLRLASLDLNALLSSILDSVKTLAKNKDIVLKFSSQGAVTLEGDEGQLQRLFMNLLDNAIKYTPPNGKVTLDLSKNDDTAVIKVIDSGIGIPESEIQYIFDRFYRVDKSRTSQGFGLGLSIVKSIVQAHKGKIEVASKPGLGTTFTVILPIGGKY
jgi:heavy metal sensor kinase